MLALDGTVSITQESSAFVSECQALDIPANAKGMLDFSFM